MLTIDDFGEGYSALNYLRRLPIHGLKLSQLFVQGVPGNQSDVAVCQAVTGIARQPGPGRGRRRRGDRSAAAVPAAAGRPVGQGFLFAPGLPPDEFASRPAAGASCRSASIAAACRSVRSHGRCRMPRSSAGDARIRRERRGFAINDPEVDWMSRAMRAALPTSWSNATAGHRRRRRRAAGRRRCDTCELRKMYFLPSRGLARRGDDGRCLSRAARLQRATWKPWRHGRGDAPVRAHGFRASTALGAPATAAATRSTC